MSNKERIVAQIDEDRAEDYPHRIEGMLQTIALLLGETLDALQQIVAVQDAQDSRESLAESVAIYGVKP